MLLAKVEGSNCQLIKYELRVGLGKIMGDLELQAHADTWIHVYL